MLFIDTIKTNLTKNNYGRKYAFFSTCGSTHYHLRLQQK